MMRNKKQILFVIDSLGCGGAEKSLVSLLPLLDYDRVDVDLMIVRCGGIFERYIPREVRVIPFPQAKGLFAAWFFFCQTLFSLLLRVFPKRHGAELRWMAMSSAYPVCKKRYDVAVAYQQGFPTYYVADKVCAAMKLAWVNTDLKEAGYSEAFNRKYYGRMTLVVPVSVALHEKMLHTSYSGKGKLYTVYDILNTELIKRMSQEYIVGDNLPDGAIPIATVGRMSPPKNYPLAVETARLLKAKGVKFCWYFVGDGSVRPHVEELIRKYGLQEEVQLVGMTANPYPYMAACDIYVQTSRFEGFGLTVCEAKILHKPVVSTNFTVVRDQILDGVNGLVAEMAPESIYEKIMSLINNPGLRDKLIVNTYNEHNSTALTESAKVNALLTE